MICPYLEWRKKDSKYIFNSALVFLLYACMALENTPNTCFCLRWNSLVTLFRQIQTLKIFLLSTKGFFFLSDRHMIYFFKCESVAPNYWKFYYIPHKRYFLKETNLIFIRLIKKREKKRVFSNFMFKSREKSEEEK